MDKEELFSKVGWCLDSECNCEECFYGRCNYHKDGVISLLKEIEED